MYCFDGIIYRLWGCYGIFALLGLICLLFSGIGKSSYDKECAFAGIAIIVIAVFFSIQFISYYMNPEIKSIQGIFNEEIRDSYEAPPLPFTMKYYFYDSNGELHGIYLDILSKKKVYNKDFVKGAEYIIYFEQQSDIIVGVEEVEP